MKDKSFENNQIINQEVSPIYENKLSYNNIMFDCIIKKENLQNINLLLISADDIYEKILKREDESENSKLYIDLIILNSKNMHLNIENILEDEATLRINIYEESKRTSAIYIYLRKVKKIGKDAILDYNINEILEKCENNEKHIEFFSKYPCQNLLNCYCFSLNNDKSYIVFVSSVKVVITKKQQNISFQIRTNYEIISKLKSDKINIQNVYVKEKKLLDVINTQISIYVENNQLLLNYVENTQVYKVKFNQNTLNLDEDYYPNEYSEYFNEYFNICKPNEKFIYKITEERKKVNNIFVQLFRDKNVKKYLITGPFSCGKSMTLFILSRILNNIIYINLKTLKVNKKDKEKCLKIILSEFWRLNLDENEFNKKFENFNFNQDVLGQLLDAIDIVLNISQMTIILILDQYKSSNINSYKGFSNRIDYFINNKNLKLVQCSSINDNEIRDLLIPTWIKFFSNPPELNIETQNFYFYYYKLYEPECKTPSQKLFRNKSKYIEKFNRKNKNTIERCLDEISMDIIDKIKGFKKYEDEKNNLIYSDIEFDDILLFLHKNMNKEFEKKRFLRYISIIPLKFFIINLKEDTFEILPLFPFLEYCFINYIEKSNCDEYFQKARYKNLSFLTNSVKGEYFEFAVKKALINKEIIKIKDRENFVSVKVYEISKMDKIMDNTYQDIVNELNEEFYNIKLKNKKEIIEVNEVEKNKNDCIFIELKALEQIDEKAIDEKIKEGYMEHYSMKQYNNELYKYKNVLNKVEFFCLKSLNDYKYDEIEIRIKKKKENIRGKLKSSDEDKVLKIEISNVNEKSKTFFTGKENIFIDQQNQRGKMVDYACLIGPKDKKIFIGFQMKCYSNNSILESKFLSKADIRENLQKMLLNCKDLFKCNIVQWYYYLIFYYNKDDEVNNQIGFYNQYQCLNQNIEFLFYDPKEKKFFSSDFRIIKNLPLSKDANLDYFTYINKKSNYQEVELKYDKNVDNVNEESYKEEYIKEIKQFEIDLEKYGSSAEKIIIELSNLLGVKNLFYSRTDISNEIIKPSFNKLYLYSKKEKKKEYISIIRTKKGIEIYDLENKQKFDIIDQKTLANFVNFKNRIYILTILETINQKTPYDYIREISAEKFMEKNNELEFNEKKREEKFNDFYNLYE